MPTKPLPFLATLCVLAVAACNSTDSPGPSVKPLLNQEIVRDGSTAGCFYFKDGDAKKLDIFQIEAGASEAWMNLVGVDGKVSVVNTGTPPRYRGHGFEITIETTEEEVCQECSYVRTRGEMIVEYEGRKAVQKIDGICGS
jgi:hypothetical protein